jgi:hypothetical protein
MFAGHAARTFFTFSGFSVVVAYMGLALKDLLNHYISSAPNLGLALLVCGVFLCFLIGLRSGKLISVALSVPRFLSITIACSFVASNINSLVTLGQVNSSPLFISIFLALILFAANRRAILWVLLAIPIVNLTLQIWETISGELLFPTIVALHDVTVDSDGWKIGEEEIRTKGLFQGPLHIVSMCLLALIAAPHSLSLRLIMLGATYLSGARLGILISLILLMIYFASSAHTRPLMRLKLLFKLIAAFSCMAVLIFAFIQLGFLSDERVKFILFAFDFTNNYSNLNRVVVWLLSLQMYLSYDAFGILFGRYDEVRYMTEQGSTESDWLRLLVDNGLLGMLVYLIAFGDLMRRAWRKNDSAKLVCLMALFMAMHLFPSIGWLAGATGFWIIYLFQVNSDLSYRSRRLNLTKQRESSVPPSTTIHPISGD